MGRIFEKRKERMFARWAKTAKAFTKLGKEIAIAVKLGGPEPTANPRLRMAIQTARGLNMPKDRIEAAIKRASSKDDAELMEISYAGYGPYGVALFIEAATDNATRTVANVRSIIDYHGGSLASSGALDFIFKRQGVFRVKADGLDLEVLELELIDYGLEELEQDQDEANIVTSFEQFGVMQRALEERKLNLISAGSQRIPSTVVEVTQEQAAEIQELINELEEEDDVQHVFHNMEAIE